MLNQSVTNMQQELYCNMLLTIDKTLITDKYPQDLYLQFTESLSA